MNDSSADQARKPGDAAPPTPRYRPDERFWPYVDLSEQPDQDELLAIDPDLRAALYGPSVQPFSITLVFPRFEGARYDEAVERAKAAVEYRETGRDASFRHRARFYSSEPMKLRDLFELVGHLHETEVLIDDRPVPFARELWLPLLWFLLPR